jgi:glycosyltransferase involved in cell wall biosynthesis
MPSPEAARRTASVIIPARNEARTIARLVRAVLDQAPPGWSVEVLLVDDGSTDETVAVARAAGARVLELGSRPGG